jgi:hypothetical protein
VAQRIAGIRGIVDEFDGVTDVGPTYDVDVDARRAALAAHRHWAETRQARIAAARADTRARAAALRQTAS